MSQNLVIVESPAKAKTIEGYLNNVGKESPFSKDSFVVTSSYGHIRDLEKGDKAIDKAHGFTPTYSVSADKEKVIRELKKLAKKSEMVYLASDDDREGEAISWHLKEVLNLSEEQYRRIVFRSVTKTAILDALNNPRGIDQDLVDAQQARRILDRLVGFELSPILWKKIKGGLSAGRVQSVAVRLVVDRERAIDQFTPVSSVRVTGNFFTASEKNNIFKGELNKRLDNVADAEKLFEQFKSATFSVAKLEKKPAKKTPTAPFTTSTLQQEASRKLGYSVSKTMILAQSLYEQGLITYMRTDSVNLSSLAVNEAVDAISKAYGEKFVQTRQFKTKAKGAQEAHEAIRPTNFKLKSGGQDVSAKKLYDLIWKRSIASQMADARFERTTVTIQGTPTLKGSGSLENTNLHFTAKGEIITFAGFLKVYNESTDDDGAEQTETNDLLPNMEAGDTIEAQDIIGKETFTKPPPRYTEASLVKQLEEKGIGRPSTYAPTISTIQKRNYVVKEKNREGLRRPISYLIFKDQKITQKVEDEVYGVDNNKLFPTNTALIVNDFLVKFFPKITDYDFTRSVEDKLDSVAEGDQKWNEMIDEFYGDFHKTVVATEQIDRSKVGGTREIGVDPMTDEKVYAKLGKYGPYIQIGEIDGDIKPKYAALRKGQFLEKITLEEALELFKLPRDVGIYEGKKIVAAIGRFGPYIRHDSKFVSINKESGLDPHTIEENEAIELIEAKRQADRERFIKAFEEDPEVQVLKGRWGPYIKYGKKNLKIPKDIDPIDLTWEDVVKLEEAAPDKKGKKTTAKKAPAKKKTTRKTIAKKTTTKKKAAAKKKVTKKTTTKAATKKK